VVYQTYEHDRKLNDYFVIIKLSTKSKTWQESEKRCRQLDGVNPLRSSGNYKNHLLWQSVMLHFVFIGFVWF
jgi:hypothetical protein